MHLVIQRDGRILVRENGEDDRFADPQDPLAIISCLRGSVELEAGLTPAQLMRSLRPWAGVLSRAGWMDFDAWIAALDRPLIRLAEDGGDDGRLVSIELVPTFDIFRGERPDGIELSVQRSWRPLGNRVDANGDTMEPCSLSFVDPREYAHLPLIINERVSVKDVQSLPPFGEDSILPDCLPGTYDRLVETPTLFETIVLGFLDDISFHGSPEDMAEVGRSITDMVAAIQNGELETIPYDDALGEGEDGGKIVRFDDFFTKLDIRPRKYDYDRAVISNDIAEAFTVAGFPHATTATVLGLTESGLMRLLARQTSSYTVATLRVFLGRLRVLKAVRDFASGARELYGSRLVGSCLVGSHADGTGGDGDIVRMGVILEGDVDRQEESMTMNDLTYDLLVNMGVHIHPFAVSRADIDDPDQASDQNLVREIVEEGIRFDPDGAPINDATRP